MAMGRYPLKPLPFEFSGRLFSFSRAPLQSGPGGLSFLLFCRSVSCLFATYPPLGIVLVAFLHLLSISDWVYIFSVSLDNSFGPDLPYQVGCRLRIFPLSVGFLFSASCS